MKRLLLAVLMLGVMGCAASVWWGSPSHPKTASVRFGMSTSQVQRVLGPPQQTAAQELNGAMTETWTYLDRTLTFQNGVLTSWTSSTAATAQ